MDNLSKAIEALFVKIDGDEILQKAGFLQITNNKRVDKFEHLDTEIKESEIINRLLKVDNENSIAQIMMIDQIIQDKWMLPADSCLNLKFHSSDSVFNMLLHFSSECLMLRDGEPVCRYEYLLRWHILSSNIGEDILTTSYLASHDFHWSQEHKSFDWDAFIGHDCKEINELFEKPMAELHMHLKGSSYNFDLSWLCMMNHIGTMQKNFEKNHVDHQYKDIDDHLFEKMKRAAAIRYYLAGAVGCIPQNFTLSQLDDELNNSNVEIFKEKHHTDSLEIVCLHDKIAQRYKQTREMVKKQFSELMVKQNQQKVLEDDDILDYIPISHYAYEPIENKALSTERKFLYSVFKVIYADDKGEKKDIATLFYAYLTYKNYFRREVLQLNNRVGFDNFSSYEEKKTDYLLDSYKRVLYKAAIEGFLEKGKEERKKPDIRFMEVRITPKDSVEKIVNSLKDICKEIDDDHNDYYDFIFHFIKKRDEPIFGHRYRHEELRKEIKSQAYAIYRFRNDREQWGKDSLVGKVVGLDAANSEISCRPEVFAQAFRFLRGHELQSKDDLDDYPRDLNITYHVGEDFLEMVDGLRAVEEALIFLNLTNGDRLGHALVLGTDVKSYYVKRYNIINSTKQVILDNLAWLHHKCIRLMGYIPLCGWLEMMFLEYFNDIYICTQKPRQNIIDSFFNENEHEELSDNIDDYYLSWLLRGDSPTIGTDMDAENIRKQKATIDKQWCFAGFNHHFGTVAALRNEKARQLFDAYHSYKYVVRGNKADTLTIPSQYQEEFYTLLEKIQQNLLDKIERKHIAIECNPSSNFKIGEFGRYDEHPIFRFFNFGLSTPYPCHDIAVSINTDDQGVFSTSLEREYSLMALAAERNQSAEHKNSPRAIINWLDRVREMSIEQRFRN